MIRLASRRTLATLLALCVGLLQLPAWALNWNKTRGPEGAWVTGIDEASDGTLWLAARGGGAYSRSATGSWTVRNNGLNRLDVVDLVIAGNGTPVLATPGGLFRFTGGSWVAANSGIPFATNSNVGVESLFRAANGNLFAAAGSLYRSTDNGQTWTETTNGMAGTVVLGTRLAQVRFVKQDSTGNLFAGTSDFANRLYVSSDGGNSWSKQENGLGSSLVLSVSTDASGNAYAYLPAGDVYRTANGGQNWTRAANLGSAVAAGIHATLVTPDNVFYAGQGSNIFITASITRSTNGRNYTGVTGLDIAGAPLNQQGAAAVVLRAVSGGRLLAGFNGAGVWQSTDGIRWTPMNSGLDAGLINAVYGSNGSLLAGGRGTGNHCTTDGGAAWTNTSYTLPSADVSHFLKPSSGNRLLMANIIRSPGQSNIQASTDGGATWTGFANNNQAAITRLFEAGGVLYSAGTGSAQLAYQQSTDGGQSWTSLNAPSGGGQDLAVDSAGNLFAISDAGVHRRSVGTTTWTRIDNAAGNGLPTPAFWASVIGDSAGNVYLVSQTLPTGTPGVYVSSNGGNSWTLRSSGLPGTQLDLGLTGLRFEKGPDGAIYLVSKHAGLFRTRNGGSSWTDETGNLPRPAAADLGGLMSLGFAADGTVFAGMEGSGVWVAGALGSGSYANGANCAAATGPDPDLDPTYDGDGVGIIAEPSNDTFDSVVDAQGRLIVLATNFITDGVRLARFTTEGGLDTGYGSNGLVSVLTNQRIDRINQDSLALQADGKLVMALSMSVNDIAQCQVVRLNTDGSLDTSFGGSGVVGIPTALTPQSACAGIDVASDGDIVVGGEARMSGQSAPFAVWRLNSDGSLDAGFDGDGMYTASGAVGRATEILSDGDAILAGGDTGTGSGAVVIRLSASGVRDTGFGTGGEIAAGGSRLALARRSDGHIAVLSPDSDSLYLFTSSGQRATGFGTNGRADVGGTYLNIRADGSLLISTQGFQNGLGAPQLTLINPDGSPNTSFGSGGSRVFLAGVSSVNRPCANGSTGVGAQLDTQGRALIGGRCSNGGDSDTFALRTRVLPAATSGGGTSDTTPDAFAFTAQDAVATGTVVTSNSVTITGIDAPAGIMVMNGRYSIGCTATFTDTAGTISNGQSVCLRHTSAAQPGTTVETVLNVGGVMASFASTTAQAPPPDTTPDSFSFGSRSDTEPGALVESETVTIRGINTAAPISVSGGEYRVNGGSYRSAAGTVGNGSTVQVRHTASLMFNTATVTTLNVGGVSAGFTSTTRGQTEPTPDSTPDAFSFQAQTGVTPGSQVSSNGATISGINVPTAISVSGGQYRIGTGAFTAQAGQVRNGDSVQLRLVAAAAGQTAEATLTIGGVSATFRVTSGAGENPDPDDEGTTQVQLMDSADRPVRFEVASGRLFNTARVGVPGGAPQNVLFRNGFFAFEVGGIPVGGLAEIVIRLPAGSAPNAYYKFGPEPGLPFDHFYRFNYDAATDTGARIAGDVVTLRIRDNGRGDHDPRPGYIADPGGPAVETDLIDAESSSGGSLGWLGLAPLLLAAGGRRRRVSRAGVATP